MSASDAIEVAFATDAGYLPWCATAIASCIIRQTVPVHIHLLHGGTLDEGAVRMQWMVEELGATLRVHEVSDAARAALPEAGSPVIWFRVLLPELLADSERVLYLDSDTFVVDDLAALWATDLGENAVGAVANVVEPRMRRHIEQIGLPRDAPFFNSGVLLMDLDAFRQEHWTDRVATAASEIGSDALVWPDQDALNVAFSGRWTPLHPRWNAQNSLWTWTEWAEAVFGPDVVGQAMMNPAILHFEGPAFCKPWHYLARHEWRDDYLRVLEMTPWAGHPLEERSIFTTLIRALPRQRQIAAYWQWKKARAGMANLRNRARRLTFRRTEGVGQPPVA